MLREKQLPRLQRTDIGDRDDLIDHDADAISDSIAEHEVEAAIARNDSTRLQRCPHCGSKSVYRWNKSDVGVSRARCRTCERTFSPRTGTWLAGLRQSKKLAFVLDDMLTKAPRSCRGLAAVLNVDKMTVWHWRRKISEAFLGPDPKLPHFPVAIHHGPIRESRKGSREWVDHHRDPARYPAPNRPRWMDVDRRALLLPHALIAYQLQILISTAEGGWQPLVAPLVCPSAARSICNRRNAGARRCEAGACPRSTIGLDERRAKTTPVPSTIDRVAAPAPSEAWLADRSPPRQYVAAPRADIDARERNVAVETAEPATSPICSASDVLHNLRQPSLACLAEAFLAFLRPFAGPAAKYLTAYAAWFIKRLEGSDEARLERAWTQLMA